jgi:hypothetical protein
MNEAENLPSRGAWFGTEDGLGCQQEFFSGSWFSLTSSAKGSAVLKRSKRDFRTELHTLLAFLGASGASPPGVSQARPM